MIVGSIGAFGSFLNLYLEQIVGLNASQIGFITFVGLIVAVIMNPIWGYLSDKTGRHEFLLKLGFFAAAAVGGLYFGVRDFFLIVLVAAVFEGLRAPISPMTDYLTTNYCDRLNYDYGKVRVYASWGFLLVAMAAGFMVAGIELAVFGHQIGFPGFISLEFATFGIFIIMNLMGLALTCMLPKSASKAKSSQEVVKKGFEKKDIKALLTNRQFVFILLLTMFGFMVVESAFAYATMHLVSVLGASEGVVSWLALFMVGPELIFIPIGATLMLKTGFKNWYILSFLTMIIRLLVYTFTTDPIVFSLGGLVHGIMITMHVIGTIAYIRRVVAPKVLGLAFTIMSSAILLSRAVFGFVFGLIYDNISSFAVFKVAAIIVTLTLIMVIRSKHLKEVGAKITATM